MPLQYFIMIISGIIGTPAIIIALLNIWAGQNIRFDVFDVRFGVASRQIYDTTLLVIGVLGFCIFLTYLHGTWKLSRHIRKLNTKVKSETLASEL
jgi:cell division protein FtsX